MPFVGGVRFAGVAVEGYLPEPARAEDRTYLDFVEGLRVFNWRRLEPELPARYAAAEAALIQNGQPLPASVEAIHQLLDGIPVIQARKRVWRSSQEMLYREVTQTFRARQAELLEQLADADGRGPGTVSYDRDFRYPAYVTRYEIHLQPGSYLDPLAGYIYHYATKVAFMGLNNGDDVQRSFVEQAHAPEDGRVQRILDLGAACGQSTTALKQRFPRAEVWGIDIAAPMVRYAHKRAADLGIEVHFTQQSVDALEFADDSVDMVHAYLLHHEVPWAVSQRAFREIRRVLRPGGVFNLYDFGTDRYRAGTPFAGYLVEWITLHNGEPFAADYCAHDVEGELRAAGFALVSERAVNGIGHTSAVA